MKGEPEEKVNHACQMSTCEANPASEWLFHICLAGVVRGRRENQALSQVLLESLEGTEKLEGLGQ